MPRLFSAPACGDASAPAAMAALCRALCHNGVRSAQEGEQGQIQASEQSLILTLPWALVGPSSLRMAARDNLHWHPVEGGVCSKGSQANLHHRQQHGSSACTLPCMCWWNQ